ncbi:unnamed protein product [Rotaria sp. Silwood1]|nr:unnamed protein product [Rotaria sp. Silwood1]CAF3334427.1 unnamed protein product [Rotaria sp. Silwood1]CAF3360115.1 unnamed protein product [Rotaria sp. Silwood1]CAF4552287.1 unnamed protein product [Rotaria sp. Silwood1]CAF4697262.1 unnamed protein product [Rotaria sp. Silwood1]
MYANKQIFIFFVLIFFKETECSFWNEIPPQCIYDRTALFFCWNTTFIHPIPLFNDLVYTLQHHHVEIRDSDFQLSLRDLLIQVGTNIENLTLINNTFSSSAIEPNLIFEGGIFFRLLLSLTIHGQHGGIQWSQLNASYFPQLIKLDLSYNQLTDNQTLVFDHQFYPKLKHLNLSHNELKSLDNLIGNSLNTLETLILSYNPLESIIDKLNQFQSLITLDLSSTLIKQLFSITLLPYLQTFICQHCRTIPTWEYEKFISNCSQLNNNNNKLTIDLTRSNINSIKLFNPYIKCIKNLILNDQNLVDSITTNDLLFSTNLESIQAKSNYDIDYIYLNVYDHLSYIDFSDNIYLNQVILRLMSNYTHLQRLILSHTALNEFSIDFHNTKLRFLHIDVIDMSYSRLETLDFLKYLTFNTLDVSYNRLKIIDIDQIHYRHGMYDLSLMNLLNMSSNEMEFIQINWDNESPHTIDLSNNKLESINLHGETIYTLLLTNNSKLSLNKTKFNIDLPSLQYLDLTSIQFDSFEYLIYLHNLSKIHTLILNNNRLLKEHRTLNWNIFYPWHQYLTHLSLRNMSIEQIDYGARLNDYYYLLTIDFYLNNHLKCDCTLGPFIHWLQTPPPPLLDFYEPLQKLLRIDCRISLFDLQCEDDNNENQTRLYLSSHSSFFQAFFILIIFMLSLLAILKLIDRKLKGMRSRFYRQVYTDADVITLNERNVTHRTDQE